MDYEYTTTTITETKTMHNNYHKALTKFSTPQLVFHLYKRFELEILYGFAGLSVILTGLHAIGVF